ncbi:MAG: hypothetical protein HXS46_09710 [Theionarchaea archaeon]|nr:hypothetical protein [Theionarchaea archaeon]
MTYVLDASAIISGFVEEEGVTVPEVIEEVKDYSSEFTLESLIVSGKLDVREPSPEAVQKVTEEVEKTKDTLSETDIRIIALALDIQGCVVSGDYGIQNVCEILGVPYVSAGVEGIEKVLQWTFVCIGCGREYEDYVRECPFCGNRVVKSKKTEVGRVHSAGGEPCKGDEE